MLRSFTLFIAALFLLTSCEKEENALVLPPPGTASHDAVDMGADYNKQIFYDFDSGSPVFTSDPSLWDLAFEASADGRHVYMNGGIGVQIYNTHQADMQKLLTLPSACTPNGIAWRQYDDPSGLPDQTGIGEWANSYGEGKGDIYIVQTDKNVYQKLRLVSVNSSRYILEWATLNDAGTPKSVQLDKDSAYNFVYFSFKNGTVKPDPPKNTWDVVFTRYRYIYRNLDNFPYEVTGALLNPYNTTAGADSTSSFDSIDLPKASAMQMSNHRDVIGYDWKQYDFNTSRYIVNRAKNYVLHTRKDHLYKLHFLEFYNSGGEKGHPAFEYKQLK
jgi:hypothetical protein